MQYGLGSFWTEGAESSPSSRVAGHEEPEACEYGPDVYGELADEANNLGEQEIPVSEIRGSAIKTEWPSVDDEASQHFLDLYVNGEYDESDPIDVILVDGDYWVWDGHSRYTVLQAVNPEGSLMANVVERSRAGNTVTAQYTPGAIIEWLGDRGVIKRVLEEGILELRMEDDPQLWLVEDAHVRVIGMSRTGQNVGDKVSYFGQPGTITEVGQMVTIQTDSGTQEFVGIDDFNQGVESGDIIVNPRTSSRTAEGESTPKCKVCGEETGGTPTNSMYGSVHKWGPTDHEFESDQESAGDITAKRKKHAFDGYDDGSGVADIDFDVDDPAAWGAQPEKFDMGQTVLHEETRQQGTIDDFGGEDWYVKWQDGSEGWVNEGLLQAASRQAAYSAGDRIMEVESQKTGTILDVTEDAEGMFGDIEWESGDVENRVGLIPGNFKKVGDEPEDESMDNELQDAFDEPEAMPTEASRHALKRIRPPGPTMLKTSQPYHMTPGDVKRPFMAVGDHVDIVTGEDLGIPTTAAVILAIHRDGYVDVRTSMGQDTVPVEALRKVNRSKRTAHNIYQGLTIGPGPAGESYEVLEETPEGWRVQVTGYGADNIYTWPESSPVWDDLFSGGGVEASHKKKAQDEASGEFMDRPGFTGYDMSLQGKTWNPGSGGTATVIEPRASRENDDMWVVDMDGQDRLIRQSIIEEAIQTRQGSRKTSNWDGKTRYPDVQINTGDRYQLYTGEERYLEITAVDEFTGHPSDTVTFVDDDEWQDGSPVTMDRGYLEDRISEGVWKKVALRKVAFDAQTLMQQIGMSNLMAVGARDYTTDGNSLTFRITITSGTKHWIKVTLAGDDTYSVELLKQARGSYDITTEKETSGVYADNIGEVVYQYGLR